MSIYTLHKKTRLNKFLSYSITPPTESMDGSVWAPDTIVELKTFEAENRDYLSFDDQNMLVDAFYYENSF